MRAKHPKILLIRLSSFGDLVLALRSLSRLEGECHWLTSTEFAEIPRLHPQVSRVWAFDRREQHAFWGWLRLCNALWSEEFDQVIDLHRSLRSALLLFIFRVRSFLSGRKIRINRVSKERVRFFGRVWFRNAWPRTLWPTPWSERFRRAALPVQTGEGEVFRLATPASPPGAVSADYAFVPSSKHRSKEWGRSNWAALIRGLAPGTHVVLLGRASDRGAAEVAELLNESPQVRWTDGREWRHLDETVSALKGVKKTLAVDTGLGHLSEALGTPVLWLLGPTDESLGFVPNLRGSRVFGAKRLWCRPCGKDGKHCIRFDRPYVCWESVKPREVLDALDEA